MRPEFQNPYGARIQVGGVRRWIGWYKTLEEATAAYDAAARELHGDFALTNAETSANG